MKVNVASIKQVRNVAVPPMLRFLESLIMEVRLHTLFLKTPPSPSGFEYLKINALSAVLVFTILSQAKMIGSAEKAFCYKISKASVYPNL